jgi:alcohol dehydrogenase
MIPLPKIPGEDVAGDVVQLGSNAGDKFQVGDRVAAMLPLLGSPWGAAADYVAVDSSLVARIGPDMDYADAAAMPLVSLTAVQALENIKNSRGKKILIHAGAGGVGSFVIQYAKHVLGMYVATTASAAKRQFLEKLGADLVIDYHTTRFEEVIRDYDVVFDTMSWAYEGCTLKTGATVLKPDGHYLNIMSSDWTFDGREKTNGLLSLWNALYHTLLNIFALGRVPKYHVVAVKPRGDQLQNIFDLAEKQKILPVVDRQYDLTDARSAYEYLEEGHAKGKAILLNDPQ